MNEMLWDWDLYGGKQKPKVNMALPNLSPPPANTHISHRTCVHACLRHACL